MIDRGPIGLSTPPTTACPLPPTCLKSIEGERRGSAALMQLLQVSLRSVLHAEQGTCRVTARTAAGTELVSGTARVRRA